MEVEFTFQQTISTKPVQWSSSGNDLNLNVFPVGAIFISLSIKTLLRYIYPAVASENHTVNTAASQRFKVKIILPLQGIWYPQNITKPNNFI